MPHRASMPTIGMAYGLTGTIVPIALGTAPLSWMRRAAEAGGLS